MEKTDCIHYNVLNGVCKRAVYCKCNGDGCVSYIPRCQRGISGHPDPPGEPGYDGSKIDIRGMKVDLESGNMVIRDGVALSPTQAAIDLIDAVERYVKQECSRGTLLARKDILKKILGYESE